MIKVAALLMISKLEKLRYKTSWKKLHPSMLIFYAFQKGLHAMDALKKAGIKAFSTI